MMLTAGRPHPDASRRPACGAGDTQPRLEYFRRAGVYAVPMTRKQILLIAFMAVIAGGVLYMNRDWFTKPPIQVSHRFHAFAGRFGDKSGTVPLLFEFSRKLKLTSVEVIPVSDLETNKNAHPVWHIVSDSNSVPTRGFVYGMEVPGMHPVYKEAGADPLDLGVKYRLLVQAGSVRAEHDFVLEPTQ
jgi:hypothetical protein